MKNAYKGGAQLLLSVLRVFAAGERRSKGGFEDLTRTRPGGDAVEPAALRADDVDVDLEALLGEGRGDA
ncbi:MAG: hypothetical protein ACOC8E_03380, partial [Planctomycetota bacterium]